MKIAPLLLALAPAQTAPPPADDPADVLREADRAFFRATRERGLESWLAWFAPDAVVFPSAVEPVSGAQPIREHYTGLAFPPRGFLWEPDGAGIAAAGDLGWTVGRWGIESAGSTAWQGRYLTVWRKDAGGWKVVADCGGEPGFATKLPGLARPPSTLGRESARSFLSAQADLGATMGAWWASDGSGGECNGKYLSVWKRNPDGAQELAAEIGFTQ